MFVLGRFMDEYLIMFSGNFKYPIILNESPFKFISMLFSLPSLHFKSKLISGTKRLIVNRFCVNLNFEFLLISYSLFTL